MSRTPHEDRLREELERVRREYRQRLTAVALELDELASDLDRVAASRAWRIGHGISSLARRLAGRPAATPGAVELARGRVRRLRLETGVGPVRERGGVKAAELAGLASGIGAALGPAPAIADPPLVSAVVHDGEAAARVLRERTDYPALRLATDPGAAGAGLVLLVGPGVVPLDPGWLRELVATLQGGGLAAAAATVLDPSGRGLSAGVRFRTEDGEPRPYHAGAGRRPLEADADPPPAVTAAALLVSREALDRAGGMLPAHGVDLALGIAAQGGRVGCSERAMVLATGAADLLGDEHERRLLAERWGPQLRREYRLAQLARELRWTDGRGPHAGISVPGDQGAALADSLERAGWRATRLPPELPAGPPTDLDYLVTAEHPAAPEVDRGIVTVGWIGEQPPAAARIDGCDLLCAPSADAAEPVTAATGRPVTPVTGGAEPLIAAVTRFESALSFCIKIAAPDRERAERWGDLAFAVAVQRELQRRGHRCLVQTHDEWDEPAGLGCDVALVLRGRRRHSPTAAQLNVLWCISHPDELSAAECDAYDLVGVASPQFAAGLQKATRTKVIVLEQATDPRVFFPDPPAGGRPAAQLAFVGNTRGARRKLIEDLFPTELSVAVYGSGWDGLLDARHLVAEHVPNAELRRIYSSGAIVLNDHWEDMRERGFISNRLYDAVACGALVVSDHVEGVEEIFGGAVVTYRSRDELRSLLRHLADHPAERAERGAAGRALVLGGHTFEHRVDRLLEAVAETMAATGHRLRVSP